MTSYMNKKDNNNLKNIKKAAKIKYLLYKKRLKLVDNANSLNITKTAVHNSIYDLTKISRVDNWIEANLKKKRVPEV